MTYPIVFPQPRRMDLPGGEVVLGRAGETVGVVCRSKSAVCSQAVEVLRSALAGMGLGVAPAKAEAARIVLEVADDASHNRALTDRGRSLSKSRGERILF